MRDNELYDRIVLEYYLSRPNLNTRHHPLCVFFFACSGSGKSTIRKILVNELGATYVSNDEVRVLLEKYPEAKNQGIELKEVIARTVKKIFQESPNKLVIYDCNIINYYMHDDSYLNVAKAHKLPIFIVGIQVPKEELEDRIKKRGVNVSHILKMLPRQINDYQNAIKDIVPDYTVQDREINDEFNDLVERLRTIL